MEEKGRRFADEHEIIEFPSPKKSKKELKQLEREQKQKEKNAKKLEKMLKKQRKDKKAPQSEQQTAEESETLDYEEVPVSRLKKKSKISKKHIIAAVLIVVILAGVVFFIANPEKMSLESISNFVKYGVLKNESDQHFPLDIQGESVSAGNFVRKGQDICFSSDTRTTLLNSYGKTVFSAPHAFISPILCSSPKKTLVYNLGNTGYQIISENKVEFSADTQDKILVADIASNGVYALVTQSSGYLSKLFVYNEDNEQIFAYSFADYYITSVSLNSKGDRAVLSGVSALNGVNIASLYLLDFTKDTPVYFSEYENNIIYDVCYLNDNRACAVGRSSAYSFNTGNGNVEVFDYEGKALTAYDINADTDTFALSLSNSGDGRNCEIITLNSDAKRDKSFSVEEKIIDLSVYKGRVALLSNDEVMLYSKDGKAYNRKTLRSDPHAVALYTGTDAYVLCTGYIDTVSL